MSDLDDFAGKVMSEDSDESVEDAEDEIEEIADEQEEISNGEKPDKVEPPRLAAKFENIEGAGEQKLPPEIQVVRDYIPDKDDMGQKTRFVKARTVIDVSSAYQLCSLYPELGEDLEEELNDWLDSVERRLTSRHGKSRKEYKEIFKAFLAGRRQDEEGEPGSFMKSLFSAEGGD